MNHGAQRALDERDERLIAMRLLVLSAALFLAGLAVADTRSAEWDGAIRSNQTDVIRALYPERPDVDDATDHGKTALMAAAAAGDAGLVAELLERGADPAATNRLGGSVLMYAIGGRDRTTIRLVLETGVPLDGQASNGWGAVMMAAARNDAETIALLGERGADPNAQDIYGWTPLMRAVYLGNAAAAEALLSQPELDLTRTNRNGQNALHIAVIGGESELVNALLERGLEQITDRNGYTPKSIADELGREDLLALLAEREYASGR